MKSTKLMTAYMSIKYIHVHVTHSKTKVTMTITHTMSYCTSSMWYKYRIYHSGQR